MRTVYSSQHPRGCFGAVLHLRIACRDFGDFDAVAQAILTCGHHRVASLQALTNEGTPVEGLRDSDRTLLYRAVRLDDINERTTLALLKGAERQGDAVVLDPDDQPDVDELPWPEGAVGVRKCRFQLHGPGALIDCVIHQQKRAFSQHGVI